MCYCVRAPSFCMNEYFDVNESGRHIWNPGAVAQVNTQTVKAEHI